MKILEEPVSEAEVLRPVSREARPEEIAASMLAKAECCVDHLCGCDNGEDEEEYTKRL